MHTPALIRSCPVLLMCLSVAAAAGTIRVPGEQPTIQAGIDAAQPGDTVLVAAGTYFENIAMRQLVAMRSESGPSSTIVDGRLLGPVVDCSNVEMFGIDGFTLQNGHTQPDGGAVRVSSGNGTIRNCHVSGSRSEWNGGGIGCLNSTVAIDNCEVANNQSGESGGGICAIRSSVLIRDSRVLGNEAHAEAGCDGGGVYAADNSMLVIEDCTITGNRAHEGGGIAAVSSSSLTMRRCLVVGNQATSPGVAGGGLISSTSVVLAENNTFYENQHGFGGASVAFAVSGSVEFVRNIIANAPGNGIECTIPAFTGCNDVWNNDNQNFAGCGPGPTDFSADPEFCDPPLELTLSESSPCAPGNSPYGCGLVGGIGVACGPVAVQHVSWGNIKATFH